jgi:HAD superfamily phosphatase (TIGR01668 family)
MYKILCPDLRVVSIYSIDLEQLWNQGIRGVLCDLDNTLIEWDNNRPSPEMLQWMRLVKERGFQVCLLSNNSAQRVQEIAQYADVPFFAPARKPLLRVFQQALSSMELRPEQTAMVGDQMFTDVLGGNRLGMYTIWVHPLSSKEFFGTRFTRIIENAILRQLEAKGLIK